MKIIKLLLIVVLVVTLGYGGLQMATNRGMVNASYQENINKHLAVVLQALPKELPQSVPTDTTEISKVASQASVVLGDSVTADEPALPQRAFEYARYNYCQAVVSDYEKRFGDPK